MSGTAVQIPVRGSYASTDLYVCAVVSPPMAYSFSGVWRVRGRGNRERERERENKMPSRVVNLTTTLSDSSPDNTATDTTAIPSLSLTL